MVNIRTRGLRSRQSRPDVGETADRCTGSLFASLTFSITLSADCSRRSLEEASPTQGLVARVRLVDEECPRIDRPLIRADCPDRRMIAWVGSVRTESLLSPD
jgi:hypothetical protein